MPSTNGHGPMQAIHWAIIYARVSGPEQIKGYSLAQQLERGRSWCAENAYKVLAEVVDAGYSGESLVRIKRPTFRFVDDFSLSALGVSFDFALAHSVFSHAYPDLAFTAFRGSRRPSPRKESASPPSRKERPTPRAPGGSTPRWCRIRGRG